MENKIIGELKNEIAISELYIKDLEGLIKNMKNLQIGKLKKGKMKQII